MSSSEHTVSVSGQESSIEESLGFEDLVEWKGPVGTSGIRDASVLYKMDRKDFFFLLLDEKDVSSGMTYRRPKDEIAPVRKEPKARGCEEKDEKEPKARGCEEKDELQVP